MHTLREIMTYPLPPFIVEQGFKTWAEWFSKAPMPKLLLPIHKKELASDGSYEAWIDDTPEARQAMSKDSCPHIFINGPKGVTYQVDWTTTKKSMPHK